MTTTIILVFIIGYAAIALEHPIDINKSATALATGVLCWLIYIIAGSPTDIEGQVGHHLGEIAAILFFLMGAMTIVEIIDAHQGFKVVTDRITTKNLVKLLWIVGITTFFLSALLDNLTTTIVFTSIMRKLIKQRELRLYFVSLVVIAANAGGAWSPMGDVTTTMLWISGQVTTVNIISKLILPSLVCMAVSIAVMTPFVLKVPVVPSKGSNAGDGSAAAHGGHGHAEVHVPEWRRNLIFVAGVIALVLVPVYKIVFHLPPFMGIIMNLGILWTIAEISYRGEETAIKDPLSVVNVIRRIDVPSVLFFLGILLAVACLQEIGVLRQLATFLDDTIGNIAVISIALGLLSAIVDNVPLVAAAMGMYDLGQFPPDDQLWEWIAYCAGTGGSCLIIGSAAGVAAMGMERIEFIWYAKKIAWIALIGYLGGAGALYLIFQLSGTPM